jgi:peptidoglycan/LPS O-acetylase OafA/YrhL
MAFLGYWPPGTNHFWSLSMQQQFYLVWPFVVWFVPRRGLAVSVVVFALIGPVSRFFAGALEPWVPWPDVLTWACFDYFGVGGLLALAVHRGMSLQSPGLRLISLFCLAGYVAVFGSHSLGWPTFGLRPLQQTLLSIGLCGFIAAGSVGFRGAVGKILEHRALQRIGQLSYGIYLFHNLAPLVAGKLAWFLWQGPFASTAGEILRLPVFAAVTWGLTLASWRWIEQPLQEVRSKLSAPKP